MHRALLAILAAVPFLTLVVVLVGCAEDVNELNYDPRAPLRVAVLPFVEKQSGDTYVSVPFAAVADNLPLIGPDDDRGPSTVMRWRFTVRLRDTQLEPVNTTYVDQVLIDQGLYENLGFLDADPQALGRILGCDAIVYGEITQWDRNYLVAESRTTVGLRIAMHDTVNGSLLWRAEKTVSEGAGISGGPTGYMAAALEPIRGLSGAALYKLADDVCREIVEPHITGGADGDDKAVPPYIAASSYTIDGQSVHVAVVGAPDCKADFRLGHSRIGTPMSEFGEGTYVGTLVAPDGQPLERGVVEIRLVSPNGGITVQRLER